MSDEYEADPSLRDDVFDAHPEQAATHEQLTSLRTLAEQLGESPELEGLTREDAVKLTDQYRARAGMSMGEAG